MKNGIKEILETKTFPGLTGTRDNFGIGKEWVSPEGKVVDNWKAWERAGYRNPLELSDDKRGSNKAMLKEKIKEKRWKQEKR